MSRRGEMTVTEIQKRFDGKVEKQSFSTCPRRRSLDRLFPPRSPRLCVRIFHSRHHHAGRRERCPEPVEGRGSAGNHQGAARMKNGWELKLSREFLFYCLKRSTILEYVIYHSNRAACQIGVTKKTLEPYPIALPSLTEQKKIVAALAALKKSLLHQAFTGQHYSLEMILAVGHRAKSPRGSPFRPWATARLTEYLVKGFVMVPPLQPSVAFVKTKKPAICRVLMVTSEVMIP